MKTEIEKPRAQDLPCGICGSLKYYQGECETVGDLTQEHEDFK